MSEPQYNNTPTICTQADFLKTLQNGTFLPRKFVLLALQDIPSKVAFLTYILLLDEALHSDTQSYTIGISQQKMADYLKVSLKTIKRAMGFLRKKGYLNIVNIPPKKGGYQANQIQVLFPEPLLQTLLHPDKPLGLIFQQKEAS